MSAPGLARALMRCLETRGIDTVFGIPGVHTVELYRALGESRLRHVTPRHEQGAGFMADGYARASRRPAACLVITGPGLSNLATAMLQARADSVPMLVISTVNDPVEVGGATRGGSGGETAGGRLHEMPDPHAFAAACAVESLSVTDAGTLGAALDRAFAIFGSERPGPVHLEIPLGALGAVSSTLPMDGAGPGTDGPARAPDEAGIASALELLARARRPLLLAGGGVAGCGAALLALAERLGAPMITTANARAALPRHARVLHASASLAPVRALIERADAVVAIGTELGQTDYDVYATGNLPGLENLVRIDVDPGQLHAGRTADVALLADAGLAIRALLDGVPHRVPHRSEWAELDAVRAEIDASLPTDYRHCIEFLEALRTRLPGALFVGDSTQLVYAGNLAFAPDADGAWFNSATGYGTLGYALSAAMGARLARPGAPVLCLIGDGGLQFTLGELATLRDLGQPLVVVVWNNDGYGEIRDDMVRRGVPPLGVDLAAPDFVAIAGAFALEARRVDSANAALDAIVDAAALPGPALIELRVGPDFFAGRCRDAREAIGPARRDR